jgi:hypothetical protein
MGAEVRDHLRGETSLKRVEFVLFDKPSLYVFQHAFGKVAD